MRLLRLYIINGGVFKHSLIDFTRDGSPQDLICLSGVNGTGKTTIMELIMNLVNLLEDNLTLVDLKKPNVLTYTEFAQLDILFNNKVISMVVGDKKYIQADVNYEQMFVIDNEIKEFYRELESFIKIDNDNEDIKNTLTSGDLSKSQELSLYKRFTDRKIEKINPEIFEFLSNAIEEKLYKKISRTDLKHLPLLYYFSNLQRTILDIRYQKIPKYEFKYDISHIYSPASDDLNALLVYYDYAYPEQFEALKSWINSYVLVDKELYMIDRPEFKAIVKTKDGDQHGLELLSSGEENLIIIATQLYLHASENTVFLIDEADQSLHPEFQERLIGLIKNIQAQFNCQVIISSHSRFIWNAFEDSQIIRFTELIK